MGLCMDSGIENITMKFKIKLHGHIATFYLLQHYSQFFHYLMTREYAGVDINIYRGWFFILDFYLSFKKEIKIG